MNFSIISMMFNLVAANIGILNHNRFDRLVQTVRSQRNKILLKRMYLQCSTGVKSYKSKDCKKLAYILTNCRTCKRYWKKKDFPYFPTLSSLTVFCRKIFKTEKYSEKTKNTIKIKSETLLGYSQLCTFFKNVQRW